MRCKMKKHRSQKLYNVIFPIWLLWLFPITWVVVLPANFLIDLAVVALALKYLKVDNIKKTVKNVIFKVWIFGFIADFIGTAAMFAVNIISFNLNTTLGKWWYQNLSSAVSYNPFNNIYAILWVTACIILTAFCIYLFNYKICLKKTDLDNVKKKKVALSLAVFTAPYLFYIPTAWFYKGF